MLAAVISAEISDPVNTRILSVSEDRLAGFVEQPFREIAALADVPEDVVLERLAAMLRTGTVRRIRQTLMATNLAPGALVAWRVPQDRLDGAFEYMAREDPFSGHVVIRSTDAETPGSAYRLWTTVKVPQRFSMRKHCALRAERTGAETFRLMPAKRLFVLGVGHMRRRGMPPGSMTDEPGQTKSLNDRGVIGRFSTFLEHVRPSAAGERVTRYNALFHWRVPEGREIEAGREIGRHHILTHAYWREVGPEFGNVNVMAVAHGLEKDIVHEHKAAIDKHLASLDIPVLYTNVFWGGRSEIKRSEVSPVEYERWCARIGIDPDTMHASAA